MMQQTKTNVNALVNVTALAIDRLDFMKAAIGDDNFRCTEFEILREYIAQLDPKYAIPFTIAWTEMRTFADMHIAGSLPHNEYIKKCMLAMPLISLDEISGLSVSQLNELSQIVLYKAKYQPSSFGYSTNGATALDYCNKIEEVAKTEHNTQLKIVAKPEKNTPKVEAKIPSVDDLSKAFEFSSSDAFNSTAIGLVQILVKAGVLHVADDAVETTVTEPLPDWTPESAMPVIEAIRAASSCLKPCGLWPRTPQTLSEHRTISIHLGAQDYLKAALCLIHTDKAASNDVIIVPKSYNVNGMSRTYTVDDLPLKSVHTVRHIYVCNRSEMTDNTLHSIYKAFSHASYATNHDQQFILLG